MDIIKYGMNFHEKEKHILCNVNCSCCGCEFNLERPDFPLMIIPEEITLERFRMVKKIGLGYTVACPECKKSYSGTYQTNSIAGKMFGRAYR